MRRFGRLKRREERRDLAAERERGEGKQAVRKRREWGRRRENRYSISDLEDNKQIYTLH